MDLKNMIMLILTMDENNFKS